MKAAVRLRLRLRRLQQPESGAESVGVTVHSVQLRRWYTESVLIVTTEARSSQTSDPLFSIVTLLAAMAPR
jgi:hypothetical protein